MRHRSIAMTLILVLSATAWIVGCQRKPPVETAAPAAPAAEPAPAPPTREVTESFPEQPVDSAPVTEPTVAELNRMGVLKTVYFAFDKSDLTEETRAVLRGNAEWLKANSNRTIVVEGHCDERGTIEYNIALGQRRARSVRDYLVSLGVDASRVRIVSFGKERPADARSNEEAWAQNRRAEFVIES
jgi:peptidoglycan-associated lipoprotein